MTLASLVGPVAAASGVVMALSPLLQARRIRALGDSSEVSAGVFLTMRMNAAIWLTYGAASGNVVIVVPNVCALVTTTLTLLTIKRFCHATGHAAEAAAAGATDPVPLRRPAVQVRHGSRVRGPVAVARAAARDLARR
jgi:uncharacterized protein with PQ loop repeat